MAMSEIEKLRAAFNTNCHYEDEFLREVFDDGTEMRRKVCANGYQHLVVRLETQNNRPWFPFFQDKNGLNSICDFIIFIELSDEVYVLLVEMKLGDESPQIQLAFTENFVKFVLRRMNLDQQLRPEKPYIIRKIGITNKPLPRNFTQMSEETCPHFDSDNYIKSYQESNFRIDRYLKMRSKDAQNGAIDMVS